MLPTRGYIFIGLNAVRALSVISLILVFASNVQTLANDIKAVNAFVKSGSNFSSTHDGDYQYIPNSTIPNEPAGAAWGVINRLLIIFQVIALLLSEIEWPASFFRHYFPVLGPDFGLGALGVIQCLLGAAILSHHVNEFTLVSAFFMFSIGCLNILCGLIWREKAKQHRAITAWKDREDILPTHEKGGLSRKNTYTVFSHDASRSASVSSTAKSGLGFGRQGEKAAGLKGFSLQKPEESLPRYMPSLSKPARASSPVYSLTKTAV